MRTPFYDIHRSLGARFTNFNGWEMPLQFTSIVEEVRAVRDSVGIFDVSHMGRLILEGREVFNTLQRLTTNDLRKLSVGRVQYNLITNERGGVKDDITVYMLSKEELFLCVNAGNREKVKVWISRFTEVRDVSAETVQIALQGRRSESLLSKYFDVGKIGYYRFAKFGDVLISRTGYTGEDGFEIYAPKSSGVELFAELVKYAKPCGLGARDVLRIEAGFPLYGHELSEEISPIEANLDRFVSFEKDFVGKEAILSKEVRRKLYGLEMVDRGVPREGYELFKEGRIIGTVSSGTFSPTLGRGIALCFVDLEERKEGNEVYVKVRDRMLRAKLRKYPFVRGR